MKRSDGMAPNARDGDARSARLHVDVRNLDFEDHAVIPLSYTFQETRK